MGLFHFRITHLAEGCSYDFHHVYNYDWLRAKFTHTVETYADLFKHIYDYCTSNEIEPNRSVCGFYVCQTPAPKYKNEYAHAPEKIEKSRE